MPTTTLTILDQISAQKSKVSERLARLDTERATITTRLTDLETAERVLTRVSKTPHPPGEPNRLLPLKQRPHLPAEAGNGRQESRPSFSDNPFT